MRLFVLTPARFVTGGPEALHQLVHKATVLGYDAAVVYLPAGDPDPVAEPFRRYHAPVAPAVVDAKDSFVVAPETEVPELLKVGLAQRGLWWLSVDNFVTRNRRLQSQLGAPEPPLDLVFDAASRFLHLSQSDYARTFVAGRGMSSTMLTDYIRTEIVEQSQQVRHGPKDDIVVYNPKKGMDFTRRLMAEAPQTLQWVPLEGLAPDEVSRLLGRAKVYVDFGNHPGRDRIPREAALCGCCVITGSKGSAGHESDLPLPAGYRFDDADPAAPAAVLERITSVLADFDAHTPRFTAYRDWVEGQEQRFTNEVFALLTGVENHQRRTNRLSA